MKIAKVPTESPGAETGAYQNEILLYSTYLSPNL
jgi:hypothetical protein